MPVASVAASFLGAAAFALLQLVSMLYAGGSTEGWEFKYVTPFMRDLIAGYLFVAAGSGVAPSNVSTFIVSLVLATFICTLTFFLFIFFYEGLGLVSLVSTSLGSVLAVLHLKSWSGQS